MSGLEVQALGKFIQAIRRSSNLAYAVPRRKRIVHRRCRPCIASVASRYCPCQRALNGFCVSRCLRLLLRPKNIFEEPDKLCMAARRIFQNQIRLGNAGIDPGTRCAWDRYVLVCNGIDLIGRIDVDVDNDADNPLVVVWP